MKTLRRITAATVLSLLLSVCVLAGQIETNGVVAPPPPPPTSSTTSTVSVLMMVLSLIYR